MLMSNHRVRLSTATLMILILGSYVLSATAEADESNRLTRVNGGVEVAAGLRADQVSTVNGRITVHQAAIVRSVETVNGSIVIENDARLDRARTVNGRITIGTGVTVEDSVRTVNGAIEVGDHSKVGSQIRNVNGSIQLVSSRVGDTVRTVNGDIEVLEGSVVEGDIVIRSKRSWLSRLRFWDTQNTQRLTIDATSSVRGTIHLHQEIDLQIDAGAQVGEIRRHY